MTYRAKQSGFTLIEILVVVTIIGILASITLLGLGPARRSAQDARRVADIRNIQSVLEVYFNKNGEYPLCTALDLAGAQTCYSSTLRSSLTIGTTGVLPSGTTLPNEPVGSAKRYAYASDGDIYYLGAVMDIGTPQGYTNPTINAGAAFAGLGGLSGYCTLTTGGRISYCVPSP